MTTPLKKIMLVEDEEDIRVIAKFSLEKLGNFTVRYCSSGKEALTAVEDFAPDLILLDMMMPEMDGVMTLQALRNTSSKPIPIIFMTAKVQPKEIEHYKSLGALDVIPKPFNPKELPNTLNQIWSAYQNG